ncbi:CDP-diacylglycerol--glycerol-3-phosphate 3-phosphatidyltransferase [Candidatus Sumerlaeota bacterium]|nr:CDP-diacylglycerol--glycerol-3-phosphate 3-phosphatidyltransferase [Candidatus Sumerlaeota bacterium]
MNLPNKLSMMRVFAVPPFVVLLIGSKLFEIEDHLATGVMMSVSLLLLIIVAITDWLDGEIARSQKLVTNLGKLLDPLADKIFVTAALVCLVELKLVPGWAVILIIAREFFVTGLRSIATERGRVVPADKLGKHKTGWQLALIIVAVVLASTREFCLHAGVWGTHALLSDRAVRVVVWIPLAVTLFLTVLSGWNYLRGNRDVLDE